MRSIRNSELMWSHHNGRNLAISADSVFLVPAAPTFCKGGPPARSRTSAGIPAQVGLASIGKALKNGCMENLGRVHNGVVVLEGDPTLPEGTVVTVTCTSLPQTRPIEAKRIEFPLVRSKHPGSLQLTAERVAEFLEAEDVSA